MLPLAIALLAAAGGIVTAPAGPPELLVLGWAEVAPLDRAGYAAEMERLGGRHDFVPVREWPADLPPGAPVFATRFSDWIATLAIAGDEASGLTLLFDGDANGKLDEPGIPLRKEKDAFGESWVASFPVSPRSTWTGRDRRTWTWIETRWAPSSPPELRVRRMNVRRGVIDLAGRKRAFAITGECGMYGRKGQELFLDLDGDGRLAMDARWSRERFKIEDEKIVVGHKGYRFDVDPAGDSLTLTRLPGTFTPRPDLEVGSVAPDFALMDLDGRSRRLSEFRGKVVLLDFWSIGCAPCVWEMPALATLRGKYRHRGFEILGVHVGVQVPQIASTCAAKGAEWPQLLDGDLKVMDLYRVDRYPTMLLLDRKGRILDHDVRGEKLEPAVRAAVR